MLKKIKNILKKILNNVFKKTEVSLNKHEKKENNFESSQIKIEPKPVIKKIKRSLKYRKSLCWNKRGT